MSTVYDYYPAITQAIDLIGQGRTLTDACDLCNISVPTFKHYIKNDPALQDMFTDAEQRSYDAMADALINIDNHRIHGRSDPKMAKVISENIKWLLAKRQPKNYGNSIRVEHNVTADKAITDALLAARQRVAQQAIAHTIDAVYEEVLSPEDQAIMDELLSQG